MSDWKIVVPEVKTNMVLNSIAGATGNFGAVGGGTMTRSTTYSKYGVNSFRIQTAANNEGGSLTLSSLANAIHYVTVRARGLWSAGWDWSLDDATYTAPALIETLDGNWNLYGLQFPAVQANGSTTLYIRQNGAGSVDVYLDGIDCEQKTYWTTHVDGDQPGCEWNGAEHASTSTRSAQSRAGGRVRDLQTDYSLRVSKVVGAGAPPQSEHVDEYALLPGGELGGIKVESRTWILAGNIIGTSWADLHAKRQTLITLFDPDAYPEDADGKQPVRLRYTGAAVQKQIAVHYAGGLEAALRHTQVYWEKVSISLLADDPFWYEIGESAVVLDSNDSATFRIVAARLRSTGQWDDLGPPAAPGTAVYSSIRAIVEDDTYVYFGGDFTDFNNNVNADRVVRYNKQTGVWSPLGTGVDNTVYALAIGPDGTLYAGGAFHNAGGGGANHIASWNGAAWAALGVGVDDVVRALSIGLGGTVYVAGEFHNAGGAGALHVASWDGAAWAALGAGVDSTAYATAIGPDGTLYVGGVFANAGGNPAVRIASWDGSNWAALGAGRDNTVEAICVRKDGIVYAGGLFTNGIASWNGTAWTILGSGIAGGGATVYAISISSDGILYTGGSFASAGGIDLADRVAKWNGSSWAHLDINLPGTPIVYAILCGETDPVVVTNHDIWLGFSTTGTGYFAGSVTASNDGTVLVFPKIVIERSGGTSATLEEVRNETTGKELLFDYDLLDGETLTIDLIPTEKSITSSFFDSRFDAILAGCEFGQFVLQPGNNNTTCFVAVAGAPTVTAYMLWQDTYKSFD